MSGRLVSLERILAARQVVGPRVHRTPMLASSTAAMVAGEVAGITLGSGRLYLKAEHLQKTGSFKARGASARVAALSREERARGIVTVSAGNAAQAYAWAGRDLEVPVVVVMPAGAVRTKVEACLGYGAEVVLHGDHVGDLFARMEAVREERGLTFAHPFDDPDVIAGHGSVGLEILEDLPDVDVVVVPVGGGGLISGVAGALKQERPSVRVYGVEPIGSNAMSLALEAGHPVPIEPRSVADGLGAPFAGEWTLAMCQRYLDGMIQLDDPTILAGMRFALERMKQVLEPSGAAALAAVLFGRIPLRDGDMVCVVGSGGNLALDRIAELLATDAPLPAPPRPASDAV